MQARTIRIRYFAQLREERGLSEEVVDFEGDTVIQLYQMLTQRHGFRLKPNQLRMAVNDAFVSHDTVLEAGDVVVFVPPVAGG